MESTTINKIRELIKSQNEFYGFILNKYEIIFDNHVDTMGTDGTSIFVNADYLVESSADQIELDFIHQVIHLCLLDYEDIFERQDEEYDFTIETFLDEYRGTITIGNKHIMEQIKNFVSKMASSIKPKYNDTHDLWPRKRFYNNKLEQYIKEALDLGIEVPHAIMLRLFNFQDYDFLNAWCDVLLKYINREIRYNEKLHGTMQINVRVFIDSKTYDVDVYKLVLLYLRGMLIIPRIQLYYSTLNDSNIIHINNHSHYEMADDVDQVHFTIILADNPIDIKHEGKTFYLTQSQNFKSNQYQVIDFNQKNARLRNEYIDTQLQKFKWKSVEVKIEHQVYQLKVNQTALVEVIYEKDMVVFLYDEDQNQYTYNFVKDSFQKDEYPPMKLNPLIDWIRTNKNLFVELYEGNISFSEFNNKIIY